MNNEQPELLLITFGLSRSLFRYNEEFTMFSAVRFMELIMLSEARKERKQTVIVKNLEKTVGQVV